MPEIFSSTMFRPFYSLFRSGTSNAFSGDTGRNHRGYTLTRGIIISSEDLKKSLWEKGYFFQFNPQTISDNKATAYEVRPYAGLPYNDYNWSNGGERIISFQLFLDDTPQSHIASFRPDVLADQIDKTSTNKNAFQWTSSGAYSRTRAHERGVLDKVELLQSFLYPAPVDNEETPKFAQGGVVSMNQFRPPATLVFALGPIYLEGVLKSAPVNYTLFDSDLTPIRATVDVEIGVFEYQSLTHIMIPEK